MPAVEIHTMDANGNLIKEVITNLPELKPGNPETSKKFMEMAINGMHIDGTPIKKLDAKAYLNHNNSRGWY